MHLIQFSSPCILAIQYNGFTRDRDPVSTQIYSVHSSMQLFAMDYIRTVGKQFLCFDMHADVPTKIAFKQHMEKSCYHESKYCKQSYLVKKKTTLISKYFKYPTSFISVVDLTLINTAIKYFSEQKGQGLRNVIRKAYESR